MPEESCIFCRIVRKEIPAQVVYEDHLVTAFRDINPEAPVHVVIIPKKHMASLATTGTDDVATLGHILQVARTVAEQEGVAASGYRVVNNCGQDAQQSVQHLHFHILGGRKFGWPPG